MPSTFRPFRFFIVSIFFFLFTIINASGQVVCEKGFFTQYSATGHLRPGSVTSLHNGQHIISGKANQNPGDALQPWLACISETGDVVWSYIFNTGDKADFTSLLETSNGKYIAYGNIYSASDPDGKIWITCLDGNGVLQWSLTIKSAQAGTERLYGLVETTSGELAGTFNIADSTPASRPVVFSLGTDGSMHWAREYRQSQAVAFNSIAYTGGKIYAAGSQTVAKRNALIMVLNAGTGDIEDRFYPAYWNTDYEQEAAFIQAFNNRLSYAIRCRNTIYPSESVVLVESSLDHSTFYTAINCNLPTSPYNLFIKRNHFNDFMIMRNDNYQSNLSNFSQFTQINWSRRLTPYSNFNEVHRAFDTTNQGGGISVGDFSSYYTNNLSRLKVVKMTSKGFGGKTCTDYGYTYSTDTIHLQQRNISWSGTPTLISLGLQTINPVANSLLLQKTEECSTSECIDYSELAPGCNKTMMVEYATAFRSQLSDAISLSDGSRMAVGHNNYMPWIIKIKENGDVDWSRFYNKVNYNGELKKIIRLTSNTVLAVGNMYTIEDHRGFAYNYLLKLDNNGNILSSQTLNSYGSSTEMGDIIATDDGGFVLVEVGRYGFPPIYNYVTRFDANMQVIWKKQLNVFAVSAMSRSLFIDNKKLYIGFEYYGGNWVNRNGIIKMDFETGNFEWSKTIEFPNFTDPVRMNRVFSVNDTVYAFVAAWKNTGTHLLMTRLKSQDGEIIDAKTIGEFEMVLPNSYTPQDLSRPTVTLTTDLDFVTANQIRIPGGEALNMSRFNRQGQLVWSHNYLSYNSHTVFNIRTHATGFQMVGKALKTDFHFDNNFSVSFLLKTDSVGKLTLASTGACAPVEANYISNSIAVTEITDTRVEGVEDNITLSISDLPILFFPAYTDATLTCHRQSDCNPVTVGMIGDVCQLNQPIKLYLENNNCGAVATWRFNSDYFKVLNRTKDTLTLLPLRAGASKIDISVEDDCTQRDFSKNISVAVLASMLELGKDTVICSGRKLLLNAGAGYQSYLWNNGSVSAELEVTQPGKYYVDVTDMCGNHASDTLWVSDPQEWFTITGPLVKCNRDTIQLSVPAIFKNVTWAANNYTVGHGYSAAVFPLQDATVSVHAEWLPGCVVTNSANIKVITSPDISFESKVDICYNDTLTLRAPDGFVRYQWSTGEEDKFIKVSKDGSYSLSALYTNGCISYDTVLVQKRSFKAPDLGPDKSVCSNEQIWLSPGSYQSYAWSNGSIAEKIQVSAAGKYWVTATDNFGCMGADTMNIISVFNTPSGYLVPKIEFCPGQEMLLTPLQSYDRYQWSTGVTNSSIRIKDTGTYILKVTDFNGCTGLDTIKAVYKADCPQSIHFPNAFTPNADGINDRFMPVVYGIATAYRFEIYNRWGELVFHTSVPNNGWDGRYKGALQPNDAYIWSCTYQFPGQKTQQQKGTFILIR